MSSTINSIAISVNSSNSTFFQVACCGAYPGSERKSAESVSYIAKHLFRKFSNILDSNNVSF